MNYHIYEKTKYLLKIVFKNNPIRLDTVLNELEQSMKNNSNNLTVNYLKTHFNNKSIILWNGSTDRSILLRLGIDCIMFNLTAYDEYNNKMFYLKLINYNTKKLIFIHKLEYVNKNGRLLSLFETHNLICKNNHNIKCSHEPISDVKFTKCIVDFIISIDKNIIKNFYDVIIILKY